MVTRFTNNDDYGMETDGVPVFSGKFKLWTGPTLILTPSGHDNSR